MREPSSWDDAQAQAEALQDSCRGEQEALSVVSMSLKARGRTLWEEREWYGNLFIYLFSKYECQMCRLSFQTMLLVKKQILPVSGYL